MPSAMRTGIVAIHIQSEINFAGFNNSLVLDHLMGYQVLHKITHLFE